MKKPITITPSRFDKMAHQIVDYLNSIVSIQDDGDSGRIFYNEDRLYTIHDRKRGMITLVFADNPREAWDRVMRGEDQNV